MPGNSGGQTTTQRSEPWDGQKPYITEGYGEAQRLYNQGPAQYYPGSTVAGQSDTTRNALNAIEQRGMGGAAARAGQQYALNQFGEGRLGDDDTVNRLRSLGASNDYANNPAVLSLGGMAQNGSGLGASAASRIGGIASNGGDVAGYTRGSLNDVASTGGNVAGYTQGALGNLASTGGNVAGYTRGSLGDIASSGGNVAGYTRSALDDIAGSGAGSNSQIRNDTYDLITGAAQNANPAFAALKATAGGNYLNGSPYLDAMYGNAASALKRQFSEGVSPGLDSGASRAGRYGSGMHKNVKDAAGESFGRQLGELATSMYGGNYATERQNQLAAANSLGGQYLQGQQLRASTAGQSAAQAAEDARLRLAATGQISGDMSNDLARRLQATGQISSDMSGDFARQMQATGQVSSDMAADIARRMQATGQISSDMAGDLSRRLSANQQLTGAESQDVANRLAAAEQMSRAYESGAGRQLQSLNSANQAYNASRAQQLQALGMQPAYQQMDYTDLNNASAAGQARDQYAQQLINADIARHDFGQNAEWQNLSRYLAAINGGSPGASVTTTGGGGGLGGLGSIFAGLGGLGQLATGTRGLLW